MLYKQRFDHPHHSVSCMPAQQAHRLIDIQQHLLALTLHSQQAYKVVYEQRFTWQSC
jgi:hypothetical protein